MTDECSICGASYGEEHDKVAHADAKADEVEVRVSDLESLLAETQEKLNRLENCLIDLARTAQHEELTKTVLFRFLKSYKVVK